MSVAENPTTQQVSANAQQQRAFGSAIGAALTLLGLWLIFGGLPYAWIQGWDSMFAEGTDLRKNEFLRDALLILLDLVLIGGLVYGSYRLLQQYTQPGLRAGIFFFAIYLFATIGVLIWIGSQLETQFDPPVGITILLFIGAALVAGAGYVYMKIPGWANFLESVEHQGWFHLVGYKTNQGVRVRRGTIVGVLAVGVAGIYTLSSHGNFGREVLGGAPNDWAWTIPFAGTPARYLFLMFKVHVLMPVVLGVGLVWVAWRVVNIPVFADFLIATEAEMNKVSWTTRKRLWQDTIVVLTTVVLLTAFLFVLDIIWIKILSAPGIQVLLIDPRLKAQEQQEKAQW